jgi:hypothetical protein
MVRKGSVDNDVLHFDHFVWQIDIRRLEHQSHSIHFLRKTNANISDSISSGHNMSLVPTVAIESLEYYKDYSG